MYVLEGNTDMCGRVLAQYLEEFDINMKVSLSGYLYITFLGFCDRGENKNELRDGRARF